MKTLQRTIHPEVKVIDSKAGLVEYVASDETVDSYREVIRVSGWKFDLFRKNSPFVDSHNYRSIDHLLGRVEDFRIEKGSKPALVETVRWAKDASPLAEIGWRLTEAGFLKAVSVGFWPEKWVSKWDQDLTQYNGLLLELGLSGELAPVRIYTHQQQVELSACILGANPNALAKAYKAEVIKDADLELIDQEWKSRPDAKMPRDGEENFNFLSQEEQPETASPAPDPAVAGLARQRAELGLLATVIQITNGL